MNKIQLSELLEKYANGTCTPEEMDVINKWYDKYHDGLGYIDTLPVNEREFLKTKMQAAITEKTTVDEATNAFIRPIYRKWWVGVAAAIAVMILVKVLFFNTVIKTGQPVQQAIADLQITNHTKNILKQIMPDSSIVWLSPNASLKWPKQFKKASRNIAMTGNCFFEVTKNPRRPFIINSEHIVTKVWGTTFRIIDSKDVTDARVTVVTGKVSVSKKGSMAADADIQLLPAEVVLHHQEQAILKNNRALVASKQTDISDLMLYRHVNVSFDNAKLTEIVTVLNKIFEVNIKIRNEKLDKAVMTADLTDLNLPEVLEVLKASMKLDYEISNNLIVLKKTN